MLGQRIYYVPPRLVGSIRDWSGKDAPNGRSWLLDHAESLGFNTVWFSPFFATTHLKAATGPGKPCEKSLYATRQHTVLDQEFSATSDKDRDLCDPAGQAAIDKLDREHLEYFARQAKARDMHVVAMADLVFNHVAADHPVVLQERADIDAIIANMPTGKKPEPIIRRTKDFDDVERDHVIGISYADKSGAAKEYFFKFAYNEKFELLDWQGNTGRETAQLNFASPAAKEFFVTGKDGVPGFWKQVMDWCMDRGMHDFRCDIAYRIPPDWWQELITHARQRDPHAVFMAETLCDGSAVSAVKRMASITVKDAAGNERPGFDLGMISNYWWNFTDDWLPQQELPRLRKMAKYGGAACPDNHDTPQTLAGKFQAALKDMPQRDQMVADICVRNYAISALIGNSVYMQMGYEYCKEKQNGVFKEEVSPKDWTDLVADRVGTGSVLNIASRIREINDLKKSLGVDNCVVEIAEHREMQQGQLIKLACRYIDVDTGENTADVVLIINKQPEKGTVTLSDPDLLALESSSMQRMKAAGESQIVVRDFILYHTPPKPPFQTAASKVASKPRQLVAA